MLNTSIIGNSLQLLTLVGCVQHDGTEKKHKWLLDWVEVTNMSTGDVTLFPANTWLSKFDGGKGNKVVFVPGKIKQPTHSDAEIGMTNLCLSIL